MLSCSWIAHAPRFSAKLSLFYATSPTTVGLDFPRPRIFCSSPTVENYQLEVVKADGLTPLLRLLQSRHLPLVLSAAKCLSRVSVHPKNEYPIIEAGFLQPSIDLLAFKGNEEAQLRAISTLRNLAFHSEESKWAVFKAGAVQSIKELVLEVPMNVQSRMAACISELAYSGEFASFDHSIWSNPP